MHSMTNETQPQHSLLCSWVAGSLRGIGDALLSSTTPVDIVKKTVDKAMDRGPWNVAVAVGTPLKDMSNISLLGATRVIVPGTLSFETHHWAASYLFRQIKTSNNDLPLLIVSAMNHSLHFAAGSAGGLSYGLVTSALDKVLTMKSMRGHILGHGALFGGYDCFEDLFTFALKERIEHSKGVDDILVVGLSGGFAGMCQSAMKQLLLLEVPRMAVLARSFPPGCAAFTAYKFSRSLLFGPPQHD
jgi:hypothetical protein